MAKSPKAAEAAQALFCAVVDYEGKIIKPIPQNYRSFMNDYGSTVKKVGRKVIIPGVTDKAIETLLIKDEEWYKSSVNIANKLFEETEKIAKKTHQRIKPKGISLFYLRDDDKVMGSLSGLYTYTNNNVKEKNSRLSSSGGKRDLTFNNLNKWSPADIYLASSRGKMILKTLDSGGTLTIPFKIGKTRIYSRDSFVSFGVLNAVLKTLMDSGDLLPLSLKKAPDGSRTIIKTINFLQGDVGKALSEQEIGYHGFLYSKKNDIFNSKDIYIKFTNKEGILLQFRDKAGTSGGTNIKFSYQGIITGGKTALDGGLAGASIGDTLGQVSAPAGNFFKESNQATIQSQSFDIAKEMETDIEKATNNTICNELFDFIVKYRGKNYTNRFENKLDLFSQLYNDKRFNIGVKGITTPILAARARAQFIYSKYLGGKMIEFLETTTERKADQMVTNMILYAGSRTISSSPHFKASDISSF